MNAKNPNLSLEKGKRKAFTLVELIIVITILAILATIAFVSFQGYMGQSRDANRLSLISQIKTGLELYQGVSGVYPEPEGPVLSGSINGLSLVSVGEFGEANTRIIKMNTLPLDPKINSRFMYGTSFNHQSFQIATTLENDVAYSPILAPAFADTQGIAYVNGSYPGYLKYASGSNTFITNIPGVLFNNSGGVNLLANTTYFVLHKKRNLPHTIDGVKNASTQNTDASSIIKDITKSQSGIITTVDITNVTESNFSDTFSGDLLASFNLAGNSVSDTGTILKNVKYMVLDKKASSASIKGNALTGGDFTLSGTTYTTGITLSITCPTGSSPIQMYVSGDIINTPAWENCSASKNVTLTSGTGTKNISMKWKDNVGNETNNISKNIIYTITIITSTTNSNIKIYCNGGWDGYSCIKPELYAISQSIWISIGVDDSRKDRSTLCLLLGMTGDSKSGGGVNSNWTTPRVSGHTYTNSTRIYTGVNCRSNGGNIISSGGCSNTTLPIAQQTATNYDWIKCK